MGELQGLLEEPPLQLPGWLRGRGSEAHWASGLWVRMHEVPTPPAKPKEHKHSSPAIIFSVSITD